MSTLKLLPRGSFAPPPEDAAAQLAALERRLVRPLPPDVAAFYRSSSPLMLFDTYRFLSLAEIGTVGELQAGDPTDGTWPRTWIAIIDMFNGNYAGVDLEPNADGTHDWLDFDHEAFERSVVAKSLDEFVRRAVAYPEGPFWLAPGFEAIGVREYVNPPSYWRTQDAGWWRSLGEERGPERCTSPGCERLRIAQSVKCKRHHYEMTTKRACPFDDEMS